MDTARRRGQRPGAALARTLGGALAVIVVTSGAFAFVGTRDDAPSRDPVATGDDHTDADPSPSPDAPVPGSADPTPSEAGSGPEPTDEPTSEAPERQPTSEEPSEKPSGEAQSEAAPAEPTEEPAATIPPGEITIQVLDGYKADGGAAMRSLAEDLRGQGYRVVAENQALDYQVTTVLWTEGNEAAARQVAAAIGAGDVRPQPGNLSESVALHIVVGADRG